jgi:hypothetical protein
MNWKRPWNSARARAQYFMTHLFSQSSPLSRLGPPLLIRFERKTEIKREIIVTLVIPQLQAQESTKRQEAIMAFTRSPASAQQTKPGNPSYFGFEEAGPESDEVLDANRDRRYSTVAFAVAKTTRDGEVKQSTKFKNDQMTVKEWIVINMKAFPLPFYASFGLMAAPPLGTRCRTCGKIHGREVCAFHGINGKRGDSLAGCDYAFCDNKGKHARKVCPTLNHRCSSCLYRGHRTESKRCGQFDANLATFEYQAGHGFVTANGKQDARLGSSKQILASYPPSTTASHCSTRRVHQATHP